MLDAAKLNTAQPFSLLKLKLDGTNDLEFATRVAKWYGGTFCVDANQGWEKWSVEESASLAGELKMLGCEILEQPFEKSNHAKHAALAALNILPVYADEGIQGEADFSQYGHCYDGVNIKLLKCGGIDRAYHMAETVRTAGKKIIVGCMSESSCGCAAALALAPLCHYLDLDGPWLVNNDPFTGLKVQNGKMEAEGEFGFGVEKMFNA